MSNSDGPMPVPNSTEPPRAVRNGAVGGGMHPAWQAFIRFCKDLRHGEIEQLKIQDGLPLLAEVTKKKVKFT